MLIANVWYQSHFHRFERALKNSIPKGFNGVQRLEQAMDYALNAGGKRIRPLLLYATFELTNTHLSNQIDNATVDEVALSLELIHTYSLVHDDLPAMDNDDFRRGKPTTHKAFDEATALLVGDALQAYAFNLLSNTKLPAELQIKLIRELSFNAGMYGMCGGQAIDLASIGKSLSQEALIQMHQLKTGALLKASIRMGAFLADVSQTDMHHLDQFANDIGLGFQVTDDILDATQDSKTLGKTAGKDAQNNKPTFVSFMGLEDAKKYANNLLESALLQIEHFKDRANSLRLLAHLAFERKS